MKFKSKIDHSYVITLSIILVLYNSIPIYSILTETQEPFDYIQFVPFFAFSILIVLNARQIRYKIKNGILTVSGPFMKEIIPIRRIHSISLQTKLLPNFRSSTAKTGLLLNYQTSYSVFITPKHQEAFIKILLDENEIIELKNLQNYSTSK